MTPQPPSSSEGSFLPPRHRPNPGGFAQDTTEHDLWAFDDDPDVPEAPEAARVGIPPRTFGKDLPARRGRQPEKSRKTGDSPPSKPPADEEHIGNNVNKTQLESRPAESLAGQAKLEDDTDDIGLWVNPVKPVIEELPAGVVPVPVDPANPPELVAAAQTQPQITPDTVRTAEVKAEEDDEFSPVVPDHAVPVSLRPRLMLSPVERLGLILLLALLLAGGGAILVFSLNHLPTGKQLAKANDFPIKGGHLTIDSAASYWRAPILEGSSRDTFRRGTQLLPVLELSVNGGPAILRVLFRNEERAVVGDAVTRTVRDGGILRIPATAGFDDLGMHAAYRTGKSKPWTIEVLEAPAEAAAGTAFTKLFEMNISTDRR